MSMLDDLRKLKDEQFMKIPHDSRKRLRSIPKKVQKFPKMGSDHLKKIPGRMKGLPARGVKTLKELPDKSARTLKELPAKSREQFRNLQNIPLKRVVYASFFFALAIAVASLTVGREIYAGAEPTVLSFSIVHFAGYLFFLVMPVELAFIYALSPANAVYMVFLALGTALLAQLIDYSLGYLWSDNIIDNIIGRHRYDETKKRIGKYGNMTIFFFSLLPISSPIVIVIAGVLKHNLTDVLFFSLLGLTIKYAVIALVFV